MSASSRLELRVGMLIVAGLAAVVILILVSDRFSFDETYQVTAYLDNASGLSVNTPVTLSGIRVGKIESIRTVTDKRGAVEMKLSINERYRLPVDVRLHVASSGIFGDAFLEFTGSGAITKQELPTDGSAEVVASPGFFDKASDQALKIMESLNDFLDPGTRDQAKRLVARAADLADESAALVKDLRGESSALHGTITSFGELGGELRATAKSLGERVGTTLDGVDRAVAGLDRRSDDIGKRIDTVAGVAVETLSSIDAAADETTALLHDNRSQVRDALTAIADVSRRGSELFAGLQAGHGVIGQLLVNQELAKDLNDVAINLTLASELIADHPEALVFGTTTKTLIALQARRDRMRIRRAFQEGYYRTPPVQVVEPMTIAEPGPRPPAVPLQGPQQR